MPISITNALFQPSLREINPVQDAGLLNDPREEHQDAITFAESFIVSPISEKKIHPLGDLIVGAYFERFGASPDFNPCKLLHMNYAFKV